MNKNRASQSGIFTPRTLLAFALCSVGILLAMLGFAGTPSGGTKHSSRKVTAPASGGPSTNRPTPTPTQCIHCELVERCGCTGASASFDQYCWNREESQCRLLPVCAWRCTTTEECYIVDCLPTQLNSVLSRKNHAGAGDFDFVVSQSVPLGVECRSGGAGGDYTMIFRFSDPLTTVGGASVTSGACGSVSGSPTVNGSDYFVNLTGVTCIEYITVTLTDVNDSAGHHSDTVAATMGVLPGDTTGDATVNSADISQTKSQSGNAVSGSNFRQDVTIDGNLNSADISLVESKSGTALP